MRKAVLFFSCIFGLLFLSGVSSEEIFAPFVSGLTAEVQNHQILLSWRAAPSDIDSYVIYRSRVPIEDATFNRAAEVVSVEGDTLTYTDTPPDTSDYYYAVLGKNAEGTIYKLFIPYRNVLLRPHAVATTLSPEQAATTITGISASKAGESIELKFSSSRPNRQVIIFRSNRAMESERDILDATAIVTIGGSEGLYIDYPLGGVPYYYAIFDAEMAKAGSYPVNPGDNALTNPVSLPITRIRVGRTSPDTRLTPLPYLLLSSSVLSGEDIDRSYTNISYTTDLEEDTLDIWTKLNRKIGPGSAPKNITPVLLQTERADNLQGEQQRLAEIVKGVFSQSDVETGKWKTVQEELNNFLNVRHSPAVKDRAEFYLGQALFFSDNYRSALFSFLLARDSLYTETQQWIDRLYPYLRQNS